MMKFIIPVIIYGSSLAIAFYLISFRLTVEKNANLFKEEKIESNKFIEERHFGLINKEKYIDLVKSLNEKSNMIFVLEDREGTKDSLLIKVKSPTRTNQITTFNRVFFNKKDIAYMNTLNDIPIRLIQNSNTYGFVSEIYESHDSIYFLKLPYDAIVGAFKEQRGINATN